jgi:hypothetical protein
MMPSLSETKPATRIKALHVGRSGGGKTVGAASLAQIAPEGEKIFILDLDGRIRPLVKMYPQIVNKIDFESYGPDDFSKMWDKVGWLCDNPHKYWGVILDGLTMLADMTMQYSIGLTDNKSSKMKKGVLDMPEIQDYKAEVRGVTAILNELRDYPRHFIMTAHLVTTEYQTMGKKGGEPERRVERTIVTQGKKIAPKIPIYFDEVYLFLPQVSGVMGVLPEYQVFTCPNEYFEECRTALSLPTIINWTMKSGDPGLYPRIMEYVKKMDPNFAAAILEK